MSSSIKGENDGLTDAGPGSSPGRGRAAINEIGGGVGNGISSRVYPGWRATRRPNTLRHQAHLCGSTPLPRPFLARCLRLRGCFRLVSCCPNRNAGPRDSKNRDHDCCDENRSSAATARHSAAAKVIAAEVTNQSLDFHPFAARRANLGYVLSPGLTWFHRPPILAEFTTKQPGWQSSFLGWKAWLHSCWNHTLIPVVHRSTGCRMEARCEKTRTYFPRARSGSRSQVFRCGCVGRTHPPRLRPRAPGTPPAGRLEIR